MKPDADRELADLRAQVKRLTKILARWADEDMRRAEDRVKVRDLLHAASKGDEEAAMKLEVEL